MISIILYFKIICHVCVRSRTAAQFDHEGRPLHYLFYTATPYFNQIMHVSQTLACFFYTVLVIVFLWFNLVRVL